MNPDVYVWVPSEQVRRISPGDGFYYHACISPDGRTVLYGGNTSGSPRIWSVNVDGTSTKALTPTESGARHPAFSWDGTQVAFTSDRHSGHPPQTVDQIDGSGMPTHGDIFVFDPDGNGARQLTDGPDTDQRPCFSPDGKTVVYVSNRDGDMTLWTVRSDGSGVPEPLPFRGQAFRPWFSADGKWIYFIGTGRGYDSGDRHQIHRVRLDDDRAEPLVNDNRGRSHGPFVDPSGEVLLMHSTRDSDSHHIWEVPPDGSSPRMLDIPGFDHAAHPTRSSNGVLAFDYRPAEEANTVQ